MTLLPGTLLGDVRDRSLVVSRRAAEDLLVLPDETPSEADALAHARTEPLRCEGERVVRRVPDVAVK